MGRPESALDPDAGPVQRLAHGLRELRRAAGGPSYRTMAAATGVSATTLSRAAGGERLPSWEAVQGYVRACGGDPGAWEPRWREAEAAFTTAVRDEDGRPPYRGLARFEPGDRELFFGRERTVAELEELVAGHRLAVLFGASGSGKSSLLRAGLIPRLRERVAEEGALEERAGGPAVLRILTPGARPATSYEELLTCGGESWVVVDQFEELFTLCRDRTERDRFLQLLLAAREPGSRLRVLISVRADFYARCLEHRELADALRGAALALGPMTPDELRETVIRPAARAGLLVERELTARVVDEVQDEPGALPMLSHALLETWRRRRSRRLTLAAYEAAGGVRGAIAATAEEVYGALGPAERAAARRLLLRLVEPGRAPGMPDTRRPLDRAEADAWAHPDVVERLAHARLLTVDEDGVQLAHEALLTCWPRLARWLEEDRERLRDLRRLTEAAHEWREAGRDPGALWRGTRLDRARELAELGGAEREFIAAAVTARDTEHRRARSAARRSRLLLASLSAVVTVALVAGLLAWAQYRDSARQRAEAAARRLAAVADSLRTTDPRTALQLSAASWDLAQLPESRRALLGALAQPELDALTVPTPNGPLPVLSADSRTLLTLDGETWQAWDVTARRVAATGTLPDGTQLVAAGPDARVLALSDGTGIRLWDTVGRHWTGARQALPRRTTDIVVNAQSYLTSDGNSVWLRSVVGGRVLFETRARALDDVAASPDDRQLAVCTDKGVEIQEGDTQRTLPGDGVCDADGVHLLFGAGDRLALTSAVGVHIWDTRTGEELGSLDDGQIGAAAFSPDGGFLATGDGVELRVWRLAGSGAGEGSSGSSGAGQAAQASSGAGTEAGAGAQASSEAGKLVFRRPLTAQQSYGTLAWDPVRPVLRYLSDNTVHTYDVQAATTSAWRASAVAGGTDRSGAGTETVARDTDGARVATGDVTGRVTFWRDGHMAVLTDAFRHTTAEAPEAVTALALSPDGRTLAAGGDSGTLQLWDTETRQPLGDPLPTPGEAITSLTFRDQTLTASSTHVPPQSYDLAPEDAARRVCARADGGLSREEWRTYVPDVGYREVCG